jgi:hypothetical protein
MQGVCVVCMCIYVLLLKGAGGWAGGSVNDGPWPECVRECVWAWGGFRWDLCGVCNGGDDCVDCLGLSYGAAVYDGCNKLGRKDISVQVCGCG